MDPIDRRETRSPLAGCAPTVERVRRAALLIALAVAGCGGDTAPEPAPPPDEPGRGGPDGGQRAGHGGDDDARVVRVPERDATPPVAILRFEPAGGAPPVVHRSPVRRGRGRAVELARPAFRATAIIRDEDGGTGRIRLTRPLRDHMRGGRRERTTLHRPPSQIERIRLTPGTRAPTERRRTARVRLPGRLPRDRRGVRRRHQRPRARELQRPGALRRPVMTPAGRSTAPH